MSQGLSAKSCGWRSLQPKETNTLPTAKGSSWMPLLTTGASAQVQTKGADLLPTRRLPDSNHSGARRGNHLQHQRVMLPAT